MDVPAKLAMAHALDRLGVDILEAGFPIASPADAEAVRQIAIAVRRPVIAALARTRRQDIEEAARALAPAARSRIHTFLATSDLHLAAKLRMSHEECLTAAVDAVRLARRFTDDVEFSAEDATRSDRDFLCRVIEAVIAEGCTTVNLPDTVGYATPDETRDFFADIIGRVPNADRAVFSAHCHNDLGLAVANSLAAIQGGVRQVECAVNGIGERAGNASLEELVMLLHTRAAALDGLHCGVTTHELARTSRLVSRLTGYVVQPNKAVVGRNAFAHESGIHQDGVLKERTTYEIMDATTVGLEANAIVLGKHSGRHALRQALEELGFHIEGQALNTAFKRFKEIADKKKQVTAMDLEALVTDELRDAVQAYTLEWFDVEASSRRPPHAIVGVRLPDGQVVEGSFTGDGPVDAVFRAINAATGLDARLREFRVDAVTGGQDALGEVSVVLEYAGQSAAGQGVATDIIQAAGIAYVRALSNGVRRARTAAESLPLPEQAALAPAP
jgi:2-isopropylmalate synthase